MGKAGLIGFLATGLASCLILGLLLRIDRRTEAPVMSVTGHVLDERGRPVKGATVFIQCSRIPDVGMRLQTAISAADGTFRFRARDGDPVELYALDAGRAGVYSLATRGVRDAASFASSPVVVRLHALTRLHVRVVDPHGTPVAGIRIGPARIYAHYDDEFEPAPEVFRRLAAVSDAQGRATIGSIPSGSTPAIDTDDDRFSIVNSSVQPPFPSELNVVLQPACRVEGQVTIDGAPVGGLRLLWSMNWKRTFGYVLTDANGKFVIRRAPKDLVTFENATTGNRQDDLVLPDAQVAADPASVKRVGICLQKGTLLKVQVVDDAGRPVSGAHIDGRLANPPISPGNVVTSRLMGEWGEVVADPDGTAHLRVKPGRYYAVFGRPGEAFSATQKVDVGGGPEQPVRLALPAGWSRDALRVQVIDAEGFPCRAKVWVTSRNSRSGEVRRDFRVSASDGRLCLDDGPGIDAVQELSAEYEGEVCDPVLPPARGSVVLRLRHAAAARQR